MSMYTQTHTQYKILLLQQIAWTSLFIKRCESVLNREEITTPAALVDDTATYSLTNRPFTLNESHI